MNTLADASTVPANATPGSLHDAPLLDGSLHKSTPHEGPLYEARPVSPGFEIRLRSQALFRSAKTYDHNEGLSCCFRQWRATHSHCQMLHGYALAFKFVIATHDLDEHNWCFDFGGMKPVKAWLHEMFDHTMLVAADDPQLPMFQDMAAQGLVALRILPSVGCEAFAYHVHGHVGHFIAERTAGRAWLEAVEVREHGGNSATYGGR